MTVIIIISFLCPPVELDPILEMSAAVCGSVIPSIPLQFSKMYGGLHPCCKTHRQIYIF